MLTKNCFQEVKEEAIKESKRAAYKAHSMLTAKLKDELKSAKNAMYKAIDAHGELESQYQEHVKKGQELRGYKPKVKGADDMWLLDMGRNQARTNGS